MSMSSTTTQKLYVGARDDQIVELRVLESDIAVDHVLDDHCALDRVPEAHDRIDARARLGAMPARAVVARILLRRELLVAHLLKLFLGAVAAVRVARLQELREHFAIPVHAP
jgi:hypothetical protein